MQREREREREREHFGLASRVNGNRARFEIDAKVIGGSYLEANKICRLVRLRDEEEEIERNRVTFPSVNARNVRLPLSPCARSTLENPFA